jgi:hypothetical protein
MSTSPSWFDQEKFSRLVKKVGPKPVPEPASARLGAEPENRPIIGEGLASTARISLVSKPPSLLSEHRSLPALPRRTTPLPTLKALFPYPTPQSSHPGPPAAEIPPADEEIKEETGVPTDDDAHDADADAPSGRQGDDLAEVWQKMTLLNEELAHTIQDRDHAVHESNILREQLRQADEALEGGRGAAAPTEELASLTRERDAALAEAKILREQLHQAKPPGNELRSSTKTQELSLLTHERDQARKEYTAIRKEFETLKQEQTPREESGKFRKELEQQLEGFRQKLEERNREIAALKAGSGGGGGDGDGKPRQEVTSLREQLARVKEEASIAQRGLALSQKALQETRDTLREATEGTSLSRHNFDNLKNECATLAQQNTVLQAQNDQLSRDLAAAKSKMTSRL